MTKIYLLFFFYFAGLSANIGPQGFKGHLNPIFVETGTFRGDGIQKAFDAGFLTIYSLEKNQGFYKFTKDRFKNEPKVHVQLRDSSFQLWDTIQGIDQPITFWLDAHNGRPNPNVKNTALLEELEQIKRHPIKTHTLMIDDLHCCGTLFFDFLNLEDIIAKILEINPDYHISFEAGGDEGEYPQNVLVATVL